MILTKKQIKELRQHYVAVEENTTPYLKKFIHENGHFKVIVILNIFPMPNISLETSYNGETEDSLLYYDDLLYFSNILNSMIEDRKKEKSSKEEIK